MFRGNLLICGINGATWSWNLFNDINDYYYVNYNERSGDEMKTWLWLYGTGPRILRWISYHLWVSTYLRFFLRVRNRVELRRHVPIYIYCPANAHSVILYEFGLLPVPSTLYINSIYMPIGFPIYTRAPTSCCEWERRAEERQTKINSDVHVSCNSAGNESGGIGLTLQAIHCYSGLLYPSL